MTQTETRVEESGVSRWTVGRIVLIVLGSMLLLVVLTAVPLILGAHPQTRSPSFRS